MKKNLLFICCLFSFFIFNFIKVDAEEARGTCIIKQEENSYSINTPFYWYEVTKNISINNSMQILQSYTHNQLYINNKKDCEDISNTNPIYNSSNNSITTYLFSKSLLVDSESIFNESENYFKIPSSESTNNLTITSQYLSLDNMPPIIATEEINSIIIVQVEQIINANYLKEKITAYDEVDGILEVKIHENLYAKNHNVLGEYPITFSASDYSGNN